MLFKSHFECFWAFLKKIDFDILWPFFWRYARPPTSSSEIIQGADQGCRTFGCDQGCYSKKNRRASRARLVLKRLKKKSARFARLIILNVGLPHFLGGADQGCRTLGVNRVAGLNNFTAPVYGHILGQRKIYASNSVSFDFLDMTPIIHLMAT